jgi:hypothetical protein
MFLVNRHSPDLRLVSDRDATDLGSASVPNESFQGSRQAHGQVVHCNFAMHDDASGGSPLLRPHTFIELLYGPERRRARSPQARF